MKGVAVNQREGGMIRRRGVRTFGVGGSRVRGKVNVKERR